MIENFHRPAYVEIEPIPGNVGLKACPSRILLVGTDSVGQISALDAGVRERDLHMCENKPSSKSPILCGQRPHQLRDFKFRFQAVTMQFRFTCLGVFSAAWCLHSQSRRYTFTRINFSMATQPEANPADYAAAGSHLAAAGSAQAAPASHSSFLSSARKTRSSAFGSSTGAHPRRRASVGTAGSR